MPELLRIRRKRMTSINVIYRLCSNLVTRKEHFYDL